MEKGAKKRETAWRTASARNAGKWTDSAGPVRLRLSPLSERLGKASIPLYSNERICIVTHKIGEENLVRETQLEKEIF